MTTKEFIINLVQGVVLFSLFAFSVFLAVNAPPLVDPQKACEAQGGVYRATYLSKPLLKSCHFDNGVR